jgi:hypothetical protein
MQLPLPSRNTALRVGRMDASREGRDSDLCWRTTVQLLFPRLDARPGPWLLFLAGVCSYVAVRTLELGIF